MITLSETNTCLRTGRKLRRRRNCCGYREPRPPNRGARASPQGVRLWSAFTVFGILSRQGGWVSLSFNAPARKDKQRRCIPDAYKCKPRAIRAAALIPAINSLSLSGVLAKHLSGASTSRLRNDVKQVFGGDASTFYLVSRLVGNVLLSAWQEILSWNCV